MPKERRKSSRVHVPSVHLPTRQLAAVNASERIDLGSLPELSGNEILKSLSTEDEDDVRATKKQKQQLKRDAWIQRFDSHATPHSKSHARRLKRKAKESLVTDLKEVEAAISTIDTHAAQDTSESKPEASKPEVQVVPGRIGPGKGHPLSKDQRKRALVTERARHPLILSNPSFSSNPFQTIRTHVQNTLVMQNEGS